jgi:cellobiose phosphorylase
MKLPYRELIFFNGLGGFTLDGREYVILLTPDQTTPAPWVNVLANEQFGSVVSETGSAYTWSENSHEFRLTPWYNDPVSDVSGEAFYIRDEQTGRFWSPIPYPGAGRDTLHDAPGFSYVFRHLEHGIASELSVCLAVDAPVKFAVKLKNHSERVRQLSGGQLWEWVLGELRQKNAMHVVTEIDPATGRCCAKSL